MALIIKESLDEIVVSKAKQTAVGTAATMNLKYLLDEGSNVEVNENRSDNRAEKTGYENPTRIDVGVYDVAGSLSQSKARPDFIAWLNAMFCNNHSEAAAGATGYLHTSYIHSGITSGNLTDQPAYFTMAHKRGEIVDFRQLIGCSINNLKYSFKLDAPLNVSADVLGVGKVVDQDYQEIIPALDNATTLTLAKEVHAESVDYVQVMIDLDDDGIYEQLITCSSVVNATKTLTIVSAGGGGINTRNYLVTYRVLNTEVGYTVFDTSGAAKTDEFVIQPKNIKLVPFGSPTDSAYTLGQTAGVELESLDLTLNRNQRVIKGWRQGATIVNEALAIQNGQLAMDIKLDRQWRDHLLKKFWKRGDSAGYQFALYIECLGPEYEAGQAWQHNIIIPRVALMTKPLKISDGLHVEEGNLIVLKDTGASNLRDIIFQTRNQVTSYLA